MSDLPAAVPPVREKPFQFTLREVVLAMLAFSFLFALLFQWGWYGFAICWLLACVSAMCYGVYWARWDLFGFGLLTLVGGGFIGMSVVPSGHVHSARRSACQGKLRQLGLALQLYHEAYKSFPPAYIADANGRPIHSWRVLILPFIEHENLYSQYRFDEPWDGPNNRLLADEIPNMFRCPSEAQTNPPTGATSYLAVIGSNTAWPGEQAVSYAAIRDGSNNTLLVVESHESGIHWMEPRDLHFLQMPMAINSPHGQGICSCHTTSGGGTCAQFVRADGSVGQFSNDTPAETVRAMLTIDGGEPVEEP